MADPLIACVRDEMREAANVFVVTPFQPIPDQLHGAFFAVICCQPKTSRAGNRLLARRCRWQVRLAPDFCPSRPSLRTGEMCQ